MLPLVRLYWKSLICVIHTFFLIQATLYDVEVRIPSFDETQIQLLHTMWQQCPGNMKIEVIRNASFWQRITQQNTNSFDSASSLSWTTIKFFFNGSLFSYLTIFYFIYRVYNVITKLHSFITWFTTTSNETALIQDVEHMFLKTVTTKKLNPHTRLPLDTTKDFCKTCKEYKTLLYCYIHLNESLESLHIRWLFPYSKALERKNIQKIIVLLETLEEKNSYFHSPNDRECDRLIKY
jgi:hypothetical protein